MVIHQSLVHQPTTWPWNPWKARRGGGSFHLVDSPGTAEYTMVTGQQNERFSIFF